MAGSKTFLLIDTPIKCMQSIETTFAGILIVRIPRIGQLISIVNVVPTSYQAFFVLDVILLSYK